MKQKFPENAKEVKFFTKKWQAIARPDFPSILPVKSDRFFACKSVPIHEISPSHVLKDFFLLLNLVMKDTFIIKSDDVTNGRRSMVSSRLLLASVEVSGLNPLNLLLTN